MDFLKNVFHQHIDFSVKYPLKGNDESRDTIRLIQDLNQTEPFQLSHQFSEMQKQKRFSY